MFTNRVARAILGYFSIAAATASAQVVINEFVPLPLPDANRPNQTHQWVELWNKGEQPVSLSGWVLTDRGGRLGGRTKSLPQLSVPPKGYLVIHLATGQDQPQFGAQGAHVYTGDPSGSLFWNGERDDIALYSPDGIRDYVSWAGTSTPFQPSAAHADAVASGIWTLNTFLRRDRIQANVGEKYRSFRPGDSIGRDAAGTDRNRPPDFDAHGGSQSFEMSPGSANSVPLPPVPISPARNTATRAAGEMAEWTVLYYLLGDNNLSTPIFGNWAELDSTATSYPAPINHVVLWDTGTSAYYAVAGTDRFGPWVEQRPNLASAKTLRDFIARAKSDFPAKKYALLMSAHGNGWKGFGPDESTVGTRGTPAAPVYDRLFMEELSDALGSSQQFELIIMDTCLMASLEVAYQIRHAARYLLASEETVPDTGINYPLLVRSLAANPGWDGRQLGGRLALGYEEKYPGEADRTMSLIDLSKVQELALAVDEWARVLHGNVEIHNARSDPTDNVQAAIAKATKAAKRFDDDNFVDLTSLALEILKRGDADCVQGPIPRVLAAIRAAVVVNRAGPASQGAGGIHIHFPILRTNASGGDLLFDSYDMPNTRILSGDTSYAAYGPNNYSLPLDLLDVETKASFAVIDRVLGIDTTQRLRPPQDFLSLPTPGFKFVRDTFWDEFLDRYYHPVAEARILEGTAVSIIHLLGGRCQNVIDWAKIPLGATAVISAIGSSDEENIVPSFSFWDGDAEEECQANCVAPFEVTPPGKPAHEATDNVDADRLRDNSKIDDDNGRELTFPRPCPAQGPRHYVVTLHVWDKDHTYPFHNTIPSAEYVHPQSDSDFAIVECVGNFTNVGLSAQAPFTQRLERILLDIAVVTATGARLANYPFTVLATNLTNVSVRDVTSLPGSTIGRAAVVDLGRTADISVPTGVATQATMNKQGFATIDFTFGAVGPASLTLTFPGRAPFTIPYTVVERLAQPADEIVVTPPTGTLTVGQDYTLLVDAKRGGAPLPDAVVAFSNPPGSTGAATMRNGTLFRNNLGSQSRTGATGRTNVTFRPIANGPVEVLVISGSLVKTVTMTAGGGPATAPDRILVEDAPLVAHVDREVTVVWRVKSGERPVEGVAVLVEDQKGQIRRTADRAAVSTLQTNSSGLVTFRFVPLAPGAIQLQASVSGIALPSVVEIVAVPGGPAPAAQLPAPGVNTLNHGASGSPRLSPGSLFSVYGSLLASGTELTATTPWPLTMGDVVVTINGIVAPLYYVSPTQINGQIPYETAVGQATATIRVAGREKASVSFEVIPANPGILVFGGNRAVVVNQNFSVNTPTSPASGGEVGTVYFSGIGIPDRPVVTGEGAPSAEPLARSKYPFSIRIDGQPVEVFYLGLAPSYPALAQANFRFPNLAAGDHRMMITVNGVDSNEAIISIR